MTLEKIPKWESELWSYMSSADGANCPMYDDCRIRQHGGWYFNDNKEIFSGLYGTYVIDPNSDESELDAFRFIVTSFVTVYILTILITKC